MQVKVCVNDSLMATFNLPEDIMDAASLEKELKSDLYHLSLFQVEDNCAIVDHSDFLEFARFLSWISFIVGIKS